ncbi:MAG: hypothetical protein ABI411_20615, partial [Tahibacter sp.]
AAPLQSPINARQAHQQQRIAAGVASGELNRREARRLEAREWRAHRVERVARRDGYVSPAERAHINRMLNRDSRAIYRQKHDAQTR